jgi:ABC-type multidrug transport system ATPase subunit
MIDIVEVNHHYGLRPVLRNVNLRIATGELVSIMGPNGSGKTTLMQILSGMLSPVDGFVEFDGLRRKRTTEEELAIRRRVVHLPADPWTPPMRTGREWLMGVGRVYGVSQQRLMEHIPKLLALFHLEDQQDELIAAYSTGQKKKIALAAALVAEAPVMLLDEPFAGGLDPSGIAALKRVLNHYRTQRDVTVIMATPVPELVEEVSDRIAILKEGRLLAFGTLDDLRQQAGSSGRLDDVYERIASPSSADKIDQYFREIRP